MKIQIGSDMGGGTSSSISTQSGDVVETTVTTGRGAITWHEDEQEITVEIGMPGIAAKDMDVNLNGRRLTVKYESTEQSSSNEGGVEQQVTTREAIKKEVDLPVDVLGDSVDAVLKKGVLRVTLRKAKNVEDDEPGERVTVSVE